MFSDRRTTSIWVETEGLLSPYIFTPYPLNAIHNVFRLREDEIQLILLQYGKQRRKAYG